MKTDVFFKMLKKLTRESIPIKKLRVFVAVGIIGLFITGGLATWASFAALNYLTTKADQASQDSFQNLRAELQVLSKINTLNCWNKAQSLLAVQPWIERSTIDNLIGLKVACLEHRPSSCDGVNCQQMKDLTNTAEGGII